MSLNSIRMCALIVGKIITKGQWEMMAFDVYSGQYVCIKTVHFMQSKTLTAESRL
jgi:hypothetical protein